MLVTYVLTGKTKTVTRDCRHGLQTEAIQYSFSTPQSKKLFHPEMGDENLEEAPFWDQKIVIEIYHYKTYA